MKKYLVILGLLIISNIYNASAQTSTEQFETESNGSTSFTDNGVVFNITSHNTTFSVIASSGKGWNGTSADNRYIELGAPAAGVSFSIKTTSNLFKVNSFWVYVADQALNLNVAGTLTVTGKLNGVTKFTQSKTNNFTTSNGINNGYTKIDLTDLNASNFSNIVIDEIVVTLGGAYQYLRFDNFTWIKDSGTILPLQASTSQSNISCNGGSNGTASVNASGGKTPYTYTWTKDGNSYSGSSSALYGLPIGNYICTIKDADNASINKAFTITQPNAITFTKTQIDVSTKGGSNGSASVTISGGTPSYTYSWAPNGGTSTTATNLAAGTYIVTITDAHSCQVTTSFVIKEPSGPTVPKITNISQLNAPVGTTLTLTGTGFDATAANNIVFFGATAAMPTTATANSITIKVPTGATYGPISVLNTTNGLSGSSTPYFNPTFSPNKGSITLADFDPRQDLGGVDYSSSIAIGDLDGDGKPDLAVTNYIANTVSVLRNTSSNGLINAASFAAKVDFQTGVNPIALAIGDLDGDGKPDLAVTNNSANTVSVLRNTSSNGLINAASFAAKVDFQTGGYPRALAIGDLDGDGKPDLAVTNNFANTISVLRNTSSNGLINAASFAAKVDFQTGVNPSVLAIGDLDGDGKPDLAVTNYTANTVSVLRNTSSNGLINAASFAAKVDFKTGVNPIALAIGDLDGDGKPDLAVANYNTGNPLSIFKNNPQFGTLPVTFGKFAATLQNNRVKLDWNTLSETNNDAFIVYRSTNGANYTQITQQTSKGSGANSYIAYDNKPLSGVNYYRLKQRDMNGTITELGNEAINFSLGDDEIKVWPNPVDKILNLNFNAGKYQGLSLTTITGQKLLEQLLNKMQANAEIDMTNYPKGIYLVELKGKNGSQWVKVLK